MDNTTAHYQDLATLVRFASGYQNVYARLINYPQDQVCYIVSNLDICAALEQVLQGHVDMDDVEMWASLLEMRGDIDHSQVEGVLYALSNPEQMGELTFDKISQIMILLK
ncbi:hypothetical protein HG263_19455 [Pseudoalteromonas sp. JBTF-M23]|uniref:Uncharacterized protein n=1 Tax=Pseudoalteromonas caenipelagi TaxID=2726988 RepID=A0A849VHD0_9GAMM|nr:hypothetical protein [Pseudoalteromonas caenipelagi]NOU52686.1 hypothetical protein [Pseudoalteromonas caenipelagi]